MTEFLLSPGNSPFTICLAIMLLLTVLEIVSACLGVGLSDMVDSVLPEMDVDIDADFDAPDADAAGSGLVKLLAWFRIGEVPVVILFIVFLTGFGLSGLIIQFTAMQILGQLIPTMAAAGGALFCAIPTVRVCGGFLGKHLPKDETYVVSEKTFIGKVADITMGTAKAGKPAQAKLKDQHGQTHYILVVPDDEAESFNQGERVIIVRQEGSLFKVIAGANSSLAD